MNLTTDSINSISAETVHLIEQAVQDVGAIQAVLECLNSALNGGGLCPARSQNLIILLDQRLDEVATTLMRVNDEIHGGGQ